MAIVDKWNTYTPPPKETELTDEQKGAFATADRMTKAEKPVVRKKGNTGPKRRAKHNSLTRPPFEGCTELRSNLLRDIVSLHMSGSTLREAFKKTAVIHDVIPNTVEKYYYKHKDAVILAEEEHLKNNAREYNHNLVEIKTMMSEGGPRAMATIFEVMDDIRTTPSTKLKAAQAVLKMMNVDGSATANPKPVQKSESLVLVGQVINQREDQDSYVIDAEILEEGNECDN